MECRIGACTCFSMAQITSIADIIIIIIIIIFCDKIIYYLVKDNKQDIQCTYNLTLRCLRTTIVAVEAQGVLHNLNVYICSLRHPAGNVHAPYYHLSPIRLYSILEHYLIKGTIFGRTYRT